MLIIITNDYVFKIDSGATAGDATRLQGTADTVSHHRITPVHVVQAKQLGHITISRGVPAAAAAGWGCLWVVTPCRHVPARRAR